MRIIGNIAIADLQVLLRDAEDVIPYDKNIDLRLHIQQYFVFEAALQASAAKKKDMLSS